MTKGPRIPDPKDRQPRAPADPPPPRYDVQEYELERIAQVGNADAARALQAGDMLRLVPEPRGSDELDVLAVRAEIGIGYLPEEGVDAIRDSDRITVDSCQVTRVEARETSAAPGVWVRLQ